MFPLSTNDFVRTRLTHSMEVSNIAMNIGRGVEKELISLGILDKDKDGFISTILGSASLVHDIGNPPFGHYGEMIIQDFFKNYFEKYFKGNKDIYDYHWSDEELGDFKPIHKENYVDLETINEMTNLYIHKIGFPNVLVRAPNAHKKTHCWRLKTL